MTKQDYEQLAMLRYTLRKFLHFSEEASRSVGLTPQQHQALLAIRGFPERDVVTVGELADRLQIQHHSAVGLVDRLESNGLCRRDHGDGDKRQVYVGLTALGESVLEALSTSHWAQIAQSGPHLAELLMYFTSEDEASADVSG